MAGRTAHRHRRRRLASGHGDVIDAGRSGPGELGVAVAAMIGRPCPGVAVAELRGREWRRSRRARAGDA